MRSKSWNRFLAAFMIVFALLLGACQSTEPEEAPADETAIAEPTGPWPTARLIGELSGHDPIEGFNRSMFEVDCVIMDYIARPLGWIWSSVLPRPVIQCIENACHNLAFPGRLVSSLGSAEFECAGVETGRFLLNSTVGIAGLFDPAEYWFHLYKTDADFGRMFATWGIGPGCRLIIPGSRHINIRDDVGSIFDYLLDIRTYLPYSSWAYVNNVVAMHPQFINVIKGSADPYRTYVMMQLLNRELQLDKWYYDYAKDVYHNRLPELPPDQGTTMPESLHGRRKVLKDYHSLGPVIDTLRAIYFVPQKDHDWWYARLSIFNSDFEDKIHTRKVTVGIDPERSRLRYGFFEAPKPKDENEVRRGVLQRRIQRRARRQRIQLALHDRHRRQTARIHPARRRQDAHRAAEDPRRSPRRRQDQGPADRPHRLVHGRHRALPHRRHGGKGKHPRHQPLPPDQPARRPDHGASPASPAAWSPRSAAPAARASPTRT